MRICCDMSCDSRSRLLLLIVQRLDFVFAASKLPV